MKISPLFKSIALAAAVTAASAGDVFAQRRSNARKAVPRYAEFAIDVESGTVLHAQNAETKLHPASLTKMMTAYITFEMLDRGEITPEKMLTVSQAAAAVPRVNIPLRAGRKISVHDALSTMMCFSANDAAVVLAEGLGGSVSSFANRMNETARKLGMTQTLFVNPNGFTHERQRSSARDMARLLEAIIRDYPHHYATYAGLHSYTYNRMTRKGTNDLLEGFVNRNGVRTGYQGVDGGKTGYVNASGFNLVVSAERDDTRVITAIFGAASGTSRRHAMTRLLDTAFARAARLPRERAPLFIVPVEFPAFRPSISFHPDTIAARLRYTGPLPVLTLPQTVIKTEKQRKAEIRAQKKQRKADERAARRAARRGMR